MSESTVEDFLRLQEIDVTEKLMKTLKDLGVKKTSHLSLLKEKDFRDAGIDV